MKKRVVITELYVSTATFLLFLVVIEYELHKYTKKSNTSRKQLVVGIATLCFSSSLAGQTVIDFMDFSNRYII